MSSADRLGLRLSNTPTTTQALRCFSGLPLFMVNSIAVFPNEKFAFWRYEPHYRQISPKKSKYFRRHGVPPQPGARADRDRNRVVSGFAGHPLHQFGTASAGPGGGWNRCSGGHSCPFGIQRPLLLQHPALGRTFRDCSTHFVTLVSRQRDDRLVYLGPGSDGVAEAHSLVREPVPASDRRALPLAVAVGGTASPRVRTPARITRRAVAPGARTVQGVPAGQTGRVHRKHQFLRRNHPQYFSAFDR